MLRQWLCRGWLPALIVLVGLLAIAGVALAQAGFELSWNSVDGGGACGITGGGYELSGAAGQHDAGSMAGGGYSLAGGHWPGSATPRYALFAPAITK